MAKNNSEVQGRKDNEGQETTISLDPLRNGIDNLLALKMTAATANADLSEAIKKIAEDCGVNAPAIRAFINAKHSDQIEAKSRNAAQLSLLFEEMEDSAPPARAPATEVTHAAPSSQQ